MENDKLLALIDRAVNDRDAQIYKSGTEIPDPCKFHKAVLIEARIKIVEQGKLLNDR
jgi:hypothetical protein